MGFCKMLGTFFSGILIGILITFSAQIISDSAERRTMAASLLVEVKHNYRVCMQLSKLDQKFVNKKPGLTGGGARMFPQETVPPGELRDHSFQRGAFNATIKDQGLLPSDILSDLREFYRRLSEIMVFNKWVVDERSTPEWRQMSLKDYFSLATAAAREVSKKNLLNRLEREATRRILWLF